MKENDDYIDVVNFACNSNSLYILEPLRKEENQFTIVNEKKKVLK